MPEVSIIIPVYKVEPYIRQCVDSVLAQTFTDFELILVDDGSPDNCGAICDEYAAQDRRVRVIHLENGGQGRARNIGMDQAIGKYIIFLDSDDYWLPETLEILHSEAEKGDRYTCEEIIKTLREMDMRKVGEHGYIPSYTRTQLTDSLHENAGFRTDYELITPKFMAGIIRRTKGL